MVHYMIVIPNASDPLPNFMVTVLKQYRRVGNKPGNGWKCDSQHIQQVVSKYSIINCVLVFFQKGLDKIHDLYLEGSF